MTFNATGATHDQDGGAGHHPCLRAPPELVFRCLTEPEHLTRFWRPVGVTTPMESITVDLRPGGVFEAIAVDYATGARYRIRAIYTDIDPAVAGCMDGA